MDKTKREQIQQFNTKKLEENSVQQVQTASNNVQDKIAEKATDTKEHKEQEKKLQEETEKELQSQKERNANIVQLAGTHAEKVSNSINDAVETPRTWVENLPHPGGITAIIAILMFFVFAVIPVNVDGDTRLKLLWLTMIGRTTLTNKINDGTIPGSSGKVVPPPALPAPKQEILEMKPFTFSVSDNDIISFSQLFNLD